MVVPTLTNKTVDSVQMSDWAYKNGYYVEGVAFYHSLIPNGPKSFGLSVEDVGASNPDKIV